MIPRLTASSAVTSSVHLFLQTLKETTGFHGEIDQSLSSRLIVSTDNSVFQVLPQAVIFPKNEQDIVSIFTLAQLKEYQDVSFSPRGGGTGTNGQSLSSGIIIDCSRYMTSIIEVNPEEGWVVVEPGVVLDQLNEFLKKFDKFFAPTLSPSNRATLGGMVSTDASGKGSRLYGKTSQHVLAITAVYPDGQVHTSEEIDVSRLDEMKHLPGSVGKLYQQVEQTVQGHHSLISRQFPKLHRFMTGYNLTRIYSPDGKRFNLNAVLTGSEGTLAYVTQIKLKLTDIPKFKGLFVVLYSSFKEALEHAKDLVLAEPEAIETMDETVLNLAKTDIIYHSIRAFVTSTGPINTAAINLVEFVADDEERLKQRIDSLKVHLQNYDYHYVDNKKDINNLWELRKRSVGLLGKTEGVRKPVSGVEDTVVPPEHLPEYVREFREILDSFGLKYGMFGHIDVGCLHVRPAFNLMDAGDRQKYYELTERIAHLTQKYGGVLWGEHGKGFRSEYVPLFFGDTLYEELRKIKSSCDPYNQLNPGKIAVPLGINTPLMNVQSEQTRASSDIQISEELREPYRLALSCNGNGACFDYKREDVICPSYKITRDRIQSPKGRASLVREWLRQLGKSKSDTSPANIVKRLINSHHKNKGQYDFSHEVYSAMEGCLSCQACKSQCPVNINVPSFRARFLEAYHSRYIRSLKNYLIAYSERMGYYQNKFPRLSNFFLSNRFIIRMLEKTAGFINPPLFSSPNLSVLLKKEHIPLLNLNQLPSSKKSIVLIQDWVTSFYEADLVIKTCLFVRQLGYEIYVMPWFENGKSLHVQGKLKQFARVAHKNALVLEKLAQHHLTMIGIDPAMVLTYRNEYPEILKKTNQYQVMLIQEWLSESIRTQDLYQLKFKNTGIRTHYNLLSHCTEQANCNEAQEQWQKIFEYLGLQLTPIKTGCCGMAGSYGHEVIHQNESQGLFELSWQPFFVDEHEINNNLVDGYSCRTQVNYRTGYRAKHPVELLYELFTGLTKNA
ncbi:FAD-binding and (Fe-S)-binding domain-containing protein [Legionella bononiensis]|uniref:FAD-binding oxidoreductase n=1 Tax=Legionella bononiensis TaxID=2793102 RepID=A0ABS1W6U5_9GAMM|nr:FAD-binding and (Fe-S)-binding domain-containing protein [Legionella bononiensis]MBL7525074.1 FAD-binding oxidoreductase [Legionella bononiensis]MBL7562799.1 FAD-binding oxidoreductase [Legionella bononiensis]